MNPLKPNSTSLNLITRNLIGISFAIFIIVVLLINALVPEPEFSSLKERTEDMVINGNYADAEDGYMAMLRSDSTNIDLHYRYIMNHYTDGFVKSIRSNDTVRQNFINREGDGLIMREDNEIQNYYASKALSGDSVMADIGHYGKGLIESILEHYLIALHEFDKVKNRNLKYLNNSTGYVLVYSDSADIAEAYFRKEIKADGNLAGAYPNLIRLLYERGDKKGIYMLMDDENASEYIPVEIMRELYFKDIRIFKYIQSLSFNFREVNFWGFFAALLILVSWLSFLRKVDIYEIEKWKLLIFTVLMGMAGSELVFPISDFFNLVTGFTLNGRLVNDFLYCTIGIGAVEELLKIIPLLVMLKFTGAINEPYDYILYASLSALGFAFMENLMYFNEGRLEIIHGRAMISVVSHMFDSSLIAYGLILNKYKRRYNPYLNLLFFFLLASLAHGFYDFWLINKTVNSFSYVTIIFALAQVQLFNIFMNNALNHSSFYDKSRFLDTKLLRNYLVSVLIGILLFEYIAIAFRWSAEKANTELLASITAGTWIIFFLARTLSRFRITKGIWAPALPYLDESSKEDYELAQGIRIKLEKLTINTFTDAYLPNSGSIIQKLTISKEPFWYLIQLDKPVNAGILPENDNSYLPEKIILSEKNSHDPKSMNSINYFGFFLIPDDLDFNRTGLERSDLIFCGWTVLKLETDETER